MDKLFLLLPVLMMILVIPTAAQENFEMDTVKTSAGALKITLIGHGGCGGTLYPPKLMNGKRIKATF